MFTPCVKSVSHYALETEDCELEFDQSDNFNFNSFYFEF